MGGSRAFAKNLVVTTGAAVLALVLGLTSLPVSAFADPPYGFYRHRHDRLWVGPPGYHAPHAAEACTDNTLLGALLGAGIGGLIGAQTSDGPDQAAAAGMGAIIGAILGSAIGHSIDRDRGC